MCISIPSARHVTCRDQQSFVFQTPSHLLCAYRAVAELDADVKTMAFCVDRAHLKHLTPEVDIPCFADLVEDSTIRYRSLIAPAPTKKVVECHVAERSDGSFTISFPLDGVESPEGLPKACMTSIVSKACKKLQHRLFGQVLFEQDHDLDEQELDDLLQLDAALSFFCELHEAILDKWTPDQSLIFVAPREPHRDAPPEHPDDKLGLAQGKEQYALSSLNDAKRQRLRDPYLLVDIRLVFRLPRDFIGVPLLGMQHNHPPTGRHESEPPPLHIFITNMPELVKYFRHQGLPHHVHFNDGMQNPRTVGSFRQIRERVQNTLGDTMDPDQEFTCWNLEHDELPDSLMALPLT